MTNEINKPPVWFWVVAVLAVAWNAMGVLAYVADVSQSPEELASQGEIIANLYAARPAWAVGAFAVAVFAGLLGGLSLLLRVKFAVGFFYLSLIALLIQNVYWFGIAKAYQLFPASTHAMPVVVFVIAVLLIWFARLSAAKSWLR